MTRSSTPQQFDNDCVLRRSSEEKANGVHTDGTECLRAAPDALSPYLSGWEIEPIGLPSRRHTLMTKHTLPLAHAPASASCTFAVCGILVCTRTALTAGSLAHLHECKYVEISCEMLVLGSRQQYGEEMDEDSALQLMVDRI
eukprot:1412952-Pleurochrysis_carterae.AAC.3